MCIWEYYCVQELLASTVATLILAIPIVVGTPSTLSVTKKPFQCDGSRLQDFDSNLQSVRI